MVWIIEIFYILLIEGAAPLRATPSVI